MSTRTKLNPMVREKRRERRGLIVDLGRLPTLNGAGLWLLERLRRIRHNPRHNGAWKQAWFDDTIARFEAAQKSVPV